MLSTCGASAEKRACQFLSTFFLDKIFCNSNDGMSAGSSFPINLKRFNPVSVTEFANALLQTWQTAGSSYKHGATLGI